MITHMHGIIFAAPAVQILDYQFVIHRSDSGRKSQPASVVLSSQLPDIAGNVHVDDPVGLAFEYSTVSVIKYIAGY